jgi:septal ring factor EnvC (AmiA/AmiB activator)
MEKTMKTVKELDAELELLKSDIEKQYEVLSTLKQRKSFLLTRIANATVRERRDAERRARNAVSAARQKAKRLAKKYDIEWDDDSYRECGEYNLTHYFPINLFGSRVMIHSRMGTTQITGMRRCG